MTQDHRRADAELAQEVLLDNPGFLKEIVERVVQELLEAEMTEHLGAAPYERNATRSGQRNGHKPRTLRTRVGTLNLAVPQDRQGTFSTRLFARYQRNEKALCLALSRCTWRASPPGRSRKAQKSFAAPPFPRASSLHWPGLWTRNSKPGGIAGWRLCCLPLPVRGCSLREGQGGWAGSKPGRFGRLCGARPGGLA
jgi:hypothetical protein